MLRFTGTALNGFANTFHTFRNGRCVVCLFIHSYVFVASILAALRQNANRYRIRVGDSIFIIQCNEHAEIILQSHFQREREQKKTALHNNEHLLRISIDVFDLESLL